ncbi:MAG: hypothetical protein RIS17_1983 [Pseudomonadota bacterium]|jgi:mxaJ protein
MRAVALAALAALVPVSAAHAETLRVCADPNNLPFSNAAEEGFENRVMTLIAQDLGVNVEFVWRAQRRGVVREALNAGLCDVIPGVASSLEMLATTAPWYRASYMVVQRAGTVPVTGFDDPRLQSLRIGVQLVGDDGANTPPAHALSRRGIIHNVRGFMVQGPHDRPDPQRAIIDAVAAGMIDVAFVWGPVADYYGRRAATPLMLSPLPASDGPQLPLRFDISMGVRKGDLALRRRLDAAIERRAPAIAALLRNDLPDARLPDASPEEADMAQKAGANQGGSTKKGGDSSGGSDGGSTGTGRGGGKSGKAKGKG